MGTPLIFDPSALGVIRERRAPADELFADLASTLQAGPWPAVDVRLLVLPGVGGEQPLTSYLALRGTFSEPTARVALAWADPPIWSGAIATDEASRLLSAWSQRDVGDIDGVAIHRPEYADPLAASPLPSVDLVRQGNLGNEAFGLPADWHFRCWYVGASSMTLHNGEGTVPASVMRQPAAWAGTSVGASFLAHLGFDLTNRSNEFLQIYLPSQDAIQIGDSTDDGVQVRWFSRVSALPADLWAVAGAGVWSLRRSRGHDWKPINAPSGWYGWEQRVAISDHSGSVKVWVGLDDHPLYSVDVRTQVRDLLAQRRTALDILHQRIPIAQIVRLSPSAAGKNGAAQLETGLGNVLASLGWQVIQTGVIGQQEGIDLLAFHELSGRAIGISVTLGNDVPRKLGHILNARQEIGPTLTEWSTAWVIATPLDLANIDKGAVENCLRNAVFVLSGEDLRLTDALDDFARRIDGLWTFDPIAEMLRRAEIP